MLETLLLIEDEEVLGSELARRYKRAGWEVVHARSLAEARRHLVDQLLEPLVVLADLSLPDGSSLDLLAEARQRGSSDEWVLLTAYGTIPDAVRAMQLEAHDFVEKPCDPDRLDLIVAGAARGARAQRRVRGHLAQRGPHSIEAFAGRSAAAQEVRRLLHQISELEFSSVILEGETGTGKGLVARILHHSGPRAAGPLVEVNCAALPDSLLESELFGHEHGAFTGSRGRRRGLIEQAHRGTLFLDEIGDMDLKVQAKLLTALEEQKFRRLGGEQELRVDVRVIAATNQSLEELMEKKSFRADLYHRLKVLSIELPPLRERPEDLRDLVPELLNELSRRANRPPLEVAESTWARLEAYDWPGNVRELRNVVEREVMLSRGPNLTFDLLSAGAGHGTEAAAGAADERLVLPLDGTMTLEEIDRAVVVAALEKTDFNVVAAARALGTSRETIRYRMEKHGIERPGGG